MFLLFLTHKYLQYKSKAPKPQKASIYILSSYSQWALLSNVPNFCGFWPRSFCGSAAITSNPNLETKWFLLLTHRAQDPAMAAPIVGTGGSPSKMGTAGVPRRCGGHRHPVGNTTHPLARCCWLQISPAPQEGCLHHPSLVCSQDGGHRGRKAAGIPKRSHELAGHAAWAAEAIPSRAAGT